MQTPLTLETGYHEAECSLELSMEPVMTLNSRSFCAVIAGVQLHAALSSAVDQPWLSGFYPGRCIPSSCLDSLSSVLETPNQL